MPCVRTSPSPRNSSANGTGRTARPGAAAPPTAAGTSPAGNLTKEGGDGAAAAAQRTPRRRPEPAAEQRLRPRRPPAAGGKEGARPRTRGRHAGTPARSRPADRGAGEPGGAEVPAARFPRPAAAGGWAARGGSPAAPCRVCPPRRKGSGTAPRGSRCPAAALCAPPHRTPPPRYRGEQRSHLLARPLLFHRGPAEIAREGDAEREADGGLRLHGWLPGRGGQRWCPQDGPAATTPPHRGLSPDRPGAPASPAPRATGRAASQWQGAQRLARRLPRPPRPPGGLARRCGAERSAAREGAVASGAPRGAAWRAAAARLRRVHGAAARAPAGELRLTETLKCRLGGAGAAGTAPRQRRDPRARKQGAPGAARRRRMESGSAASDHGCLTLASHSTLSRWLVTTDKPLPRKLKFSTPGACLGLIFFFL